ncbi:MAG: multiubiquitin domain-containing protein [Propionibacteriaceae bacterium]
MSDLAHHGTSRPAEHLTIRIDGRHFSLTEGQQTAAELLQLAGLDPARYDLAQIVHGTTTRFVDDQTIDLHEGDKFVSIRQEASVA